MFGGFGFGGFRDDIIIDNGFGMGMGMGRQVIIENNGFGRGQEVIIQNRGFFGRQQEIIVNNGYGMGGSTTIIQNRGLFGPRQEIIVNNNGYGMGGSTTIIQNGGFFGPRQEIIINNGGFGGTQVIICQPGCMRACCAYKRNQVVVCEVGCMRACCAYKRNQVVVCEVGCMRACCAYKRNQVVVCEVGCMKVCCAYKQNQYVEVVEPVITGQPIQPVMQQPLNYSPYNTNNYFNQQPVQNMPPQILFQLPLLQLKYQKWVGPRNHQLTRAGFDRYGLPSIRKIKCRTNYQPFSNFLENGQIIMKVVVGPTDTFFAAKSYILKDYFINSALLKIRWNGSFNVNSQTFLGEIEGRILKKSDFLGNWEQRFIKITKTQGLMSFRNPSHNHTMHVKSTKQIWSWFEVINGKFLVIKIKHNLKKLEFGIPLNQCQIWLEAFFSLLETYQ